MSEDYTGGTWPPLYSIKKSPRAKQVKLKATVKHGLELIVPLRFNAKHIESILDTNRAWIEKHLSMIQERLNAAAAVPLPEQLLLPIADQVWRIQYIQSDNKKIVLFQRPDQELVIYGDTSNHDECRKCLVKWLKKYAKKILLERITALSELTHLPFQKLVVKSQQTRWGSCSSDKNINLNYKLIFLTPKLADHIILHELCHTKHMNHSATFWNLVAKYDADWKNNTKAVRNSDHSIPAWIEKI